MVGYTTLLRFNSCVTAPQHLDDDSIRPDHPAEVSFNESAGRGDLLYLTLHLDNGKECLFAVDTGAPITILDKSLESSLGRPHGSIILSSSYGAGKVRWYRAPILHLANSRLLTGDWVVTYDLKRIPTPHPVTGVLGMDSLRHYCLQLDFNANKLRFLNPDRLGVENLGRAFPLTFSTGLVSVFVNENLFGVEGVRSQIDTGDYSEGGVAPDLFQRALDEQKAVVTNRFKATSSRMAREAFFPAITFGGEPYTGLRLWEYSGENMIGLRFLARHLVTFNFPKRTMYLLRRTREDPER